MPLRTLGQRPALISPQSALAFAGKIIVIFRIICFLRLVSEVILPPQGQMGKLSPAGNRDRTADSQAKPTWRVELASVSPSVWEVVGFLPSPQESLQAADPAPGAGSLLLCPPS